MDIYKRFIFDIKKDLINFDYIENVISVYLCGSVARGDYFVNASDIDLYIILGNKDIKIEEMLTKFIFHKATDILSELLTWCPDGVSISYIYYDEIKKGESWLAIGSEYFSFIKYAMLLYGKDIKNNIVLPKDEDIKKITSETIIQLKSTLNLLDNEKLSNDKYFVRGIFGGIFTAIHLFLAKNKNYERKKEIMVNEMIKLDKSYEKKLCVTMLLWDKFTNNLLDYKEVLDLVDVYKYIVTSL